ncbi:hypothetical protein TCAL_06109 [Tigriopus californicus]|uniref:Uncharacterized protein n=1 Tax=Tigriopus californicus TaxID=6832 RepID=A0A553NX15_TIGCA|nr:uncharacterized protein LOC131886521 [Tigriopus californicus]TRY69974.1 hypothetical protein TCAL_06109 [Tigriopus californicus]|eukprot:TCALIF_06109-PA protein Name:"Protein of unknown function" AED:0.00 eAED:0.00 QI:265/1/1/1/0.25/0.4/5/233/184
MNKIILVTSSNTLKGLALITFIAFTLTISTTNASHVDEGSRSKDQGSSLPRESLRLQARADRRYLDRLSDKLNGLHPPPPPSPNSFNVQKMRDTTTTWSKRHSLSRQRRGRCMTDGQLCLFRSALVGGVMKLPCCPGSTCTLMGSRFLCANDKELYARFGEGNEPEVINLDEDELAELGDVLGG